MIDISRLVQAQIANWSERDQTESAFRRPGSFVDRGVAYGPCLLISREYGSGGGIVARRVGECLQWNVYDREIVDHIAQLSQVRQQLVETVDERAQSRWERTWREILADGDMADEEYLRCLRLVVMSLGHHGQVVIVGRGAQHLLPPACALRVRLVASPELRAKRVAEREKMSLDQARAKIQTFDNERSLFIRRTFKTDASAGLNYDLVINTDEITLESAVQIVLAGISEKLGVRRAKAPNPAG